MDFWHSWTRLGVFHVNTLIGMYSKYGRIREARHVFDTMSERNGASWNNMVSAYVRSECYREATDLFVEMWNQGIEVNGFVTASILTAFSRSNCMVLKGLQIHDLVLKNGLLQDVFVSTSLLHFYGVYGFLASAWKLFSEMPERNVVSWTSLMVGCSDHGENGVVIDIYKKMVLEGAYCNQNTFTTVISSCGAVDDKLLGYQLLSHIIKSGFEDNTSVANSLVSVFGNFGHIEEAHYVFSCIKDLDTVSWNSMIAAYANNFLWEDSFRCLRLMRLDHCEISPTTLCPLLSVCGTLGNSNIGKGVHGLVVKLGWDTSVCVCNTLLTMYCETGSCEDAESLFQGMKIQDSISWNSMMAGYNVQRRSLKALRLMSFLLRTGKSINYVTFTSALAACSCEEYAAEGRILHALVVVFGLYDNLVIGNALITMYGKSRTMSEADRVFQNMPEKELVTWNALIGGYAENEEPEKAVRVFKLMRAASEPANYITMINIIGACLSPYDLLKLAMPLHAHTVLTGFERDAYVINSLITMYANCGDLNSSQLIYDKLVSKTSATWAAMVAANAHNGNGEEALKLILEMQRAKVDFDEYSLSAALSVTADLASLEEGRQLHSLAIKLGFDSYHFVTNTTMDMYGKCGEISDVLEMLPEPQSRSRLSWNTIISSLSKHGLFQKARETFHEMLEQGSKPDHVTFVALLSACSHGGLVDEGLAYFDSMTSDFGVLAGIEHYVCIVDLLGRSGRLAEAEEFISKMPVPPNDYIWRSLLAACRVHGNTDLGKKAAERLLESNPSDDSAYVLCSNVFAASGKWQDMHNVRVRMESERVKKQPGYSWVKWRDNVCVFGMGDHSHPQFEQINEKLMELKNKIKEAGYVPDTSFALQDTDEEQKEHNLWNHSERIALAYSLVSIPKDSTLRIFKNLRVCGDCHSVYKLVSSFVQREIILRDPYRFHHFRDGKCSCGDYW